MLYYLLRPFTRIAFQAFYRAIYLTGTAHIPARGAVLFTPNHPTAFIEPCFLACYAGRDLYFMTRGDVFVNRLVRWLLRQVHLIPIFRFHDGFANLRRNEDSMQEGREILGKGKALLVMAEGGMRHEKRLRPIRRGAARLAFEAMAEFGLPEVSIVPVGVNYTRAEKARTVLMVSIAPPIRISDWQALYSTRPREAIDAVTDLIRQRLAERVIHIADPGEEELAEWILDLCRTERASPTWPVIRHTEGPLVSERIAMDTLHRLSEQDKEDLRMAGAAYRSLLSRAGVSDRQVVLAPDRHPGRLPMFLLRSGLGLLALPHALPIALARWITDACVRIIEFRSSVLLALLMLFWTTWALAVSAVAGYNWGWAAFFLSLAGFPAGLALWIALREYVISQGYYARRRSVSLAILRNARQSFSDVWLQKSAKRNGPKPSAPDRF